MGSLEHHPQNMGSGLQQGPYRAGEALSKDCVALKGACDGAADLHRRRVQFLTSQHEERVVAKVILPVGTVETVMLALLELKGPQALLGGGFHLNKSGFEVVLLQSLVL